MTNIIDNYGDFVKERYFLNTYNTFPSELEVDIAMDMKKEKIPSILAFLDMEKYELEEIFRQWKTNSYKNEEECYPKYIFYSSKQKKLCIEVTFQEKEFSFNFLYDNKDLALETWIKKVYLRLKKELGKPKTPVFKVLTLSGNDFYTEEVNIDHFEINVADYYNDDFQEINTIIEESLTTNTSGLMLLYGDPGTGKTSYIKHLLNKYKDTNFIFVQNDFVHKLLKPDFISFLISNKNSVLIIEDAEKVIMSRESGNGQSVVSTILQLTDGLFSDYLNIKIICTFNTNLKNIDKALLRKGRMIAFYEFKALNAQKTNAILNQLELPPQNKAMTLAEIFNVRKKDFEGVGKKKIGFG